MSKLIRLVDIEDVNLKTLSVEIKALAVSGKQMTLSVFRQLPNEPILNDNIDLRGTAWGHVNYFWKENEGDLHLVWQINDKLCRSPIKKREIYQYQEKLRDLSRERKGLADAIKDVKEHLPKTITTWTNHICNEREPIDDDKINMTFYNETAFWIKEKSPYTFGFLRKFIASGEDRLLEMKKEIEQEHASSIDRHKKYMAHFNSFAQLPQLFIAM
jgi:hypothetical protein